MYYEYKITLCCKRVGIVLLVVYFLDRVTKISLAIYLHYKISPTYKDN